MSNTFSWNQEIPSQYWGKKRRTKRIASEEDGKKKSWKNNKREGTLGQFLPPTTPRESDRTIITRPGAEINAQAGVREKGDAEDNNINSPVGKLVQIKRGGTIRVGRGAASIRKTLQKYAEREKANPPNQQSSGNASRGRDNTGHFTRKETAWDKLP